MENEYKNWTTLRLLHYHYWKPDYKQIKEVREELKARDYPLDEELKQIQKHSDDDEGC